MTALVASLASGLVMSTLPGRGSWGGSVMTALVASPAIAILVKAGWSADAYFRREES